MSRRIVYSLDWRQAEEVRRRPKPTHGQRLWGESPDAYGLVR